LLITLTPIPTPHRLKWAYILNASSFFKLVISMYLLVPFGLALIPI
jgi:hypothetical protein